MSQLKRFHHFSFSAESLGVVSVKEYSDSKSMVVMLFDEEWQPAAHELPAAITPAEFPLARQLYLYEQIREYRRDGTEYLYAQIHIWQIMSTHLILHQPRISMVKLLHHTMHHTQNECGD